MSAGAATFFISSGREPKKEIICDLSNPVRRRSQVHFLASIHQYKNSIQIVCAKCSFEFLDGSKWKF